MTNFKYDIVTLIELVESKPCLWDKTDENNKNKILRDKSWKEIFAYLEDGYEQLNQAEKKKTGEMIMNKWSNIRDSFIRSLRTKTGQGARRSYMFSEHLQFLTKIAQKDDTESNFSQASFEEDTVGDSESSQLLPPTASSSKSQSFVPTSSNQRSVSNKASKSKRELDFIEREILSQLKKTKPSDEIRSENPSHHARTDHEILLLSFLPYIRDMQETELMDFQMEVLKIIKNIKQDRVTNQTTLASHLSRPLPSPSSDTQDLLSVPQLPSPANHDQCSESQQNLPYQSPSPSSPVESQCSEKRLAGIQAESGKNVYQELFNRSASQCE